MVIATQTILIFFEVLKSTNANTTTLNKIISSEKSVKCFQIAGDL